MKFRDFRTSGGIIFEFPIKIAFKVFETKDLLLATCDFLQISYSIFIKHTNFFILNLLGILPFQGSNVLFHHFPQKIITSTESENFHNIQTPWFVINLNLPLFLGWKDQILSLPKKWLSQTSDTDEFGFPGVKVEQLLSLSLEFRRMHDISITRRRFCFL